MSESISRMFSRSKSHKYFDSSELVDLNPEEIDKIRVGEVGLHTIDYAIAILDKKYDKYDKIKNKSAAATMGYVAEQLAALKSLKSAKEDSKNGDNTTAEARDIASGKRIDGATRRIQAEIEKLDRDAESEEILRILQKRLDALGSIDGVSKGGTRRGRKGRKYKSNRNKRHKTKNQKWWI